MSNAYRTSCGGTNGGHRAVECWLYSDGQVHIGERQGFDIDGRWNSTEACVRLLPVEARGMAEWILAHVQAPIIPSRGPAVEGGLVERHEGTVAP